MEVSKENGVAPSPQEEWINYMRKQLADALAPNGFKKKDGVIIARLNYLSQDRCTEIVNFATRYLAFKDKRVEQELNNELLVLRSARQKLDEQLQAAKKKWFNRKEVRGIETQIEQVGSMAVGIDRAVRIFRALKREG